MSLLRPRNLDLAMLSTPLMRSGSAWEQCVWISVPEVFRGRIPEPGEGEGKGGPSSAHAEGCWKRQGGHSLWYHWDLCIPCHSGLPWEDLSLQTREIHVLWSSGCLTDTGSSNRWFPTLLGDVSPGCFEPNLHLTIRVAPSHGLCFCYQFYPQKICFSVLNYPLVRFLHLFFSPIVSHLFL